MTAPIFISFATADRPYSLRVVAFLEAHHLPCWVAYRDVAAGENYQEAITRAIRSAQVVIVLLSESANVSIEILKELSLASRYKVRIVPLRMEDVEPSDALAYELATHQWIDMFRHWEAGCERLLSELAHIVAAPDSNPRNTPSPALVEAMTGRQPTRASRSGSIFIPPRGAVPPPPPGADRSDRSALIVAEPDGGGRLIGVAKFVVVALTSSLLLMDSLEGGEASMLGLFFWGVLVIGCVRFIATIYRLLTDGLRANQA
jgi:hypothetical protein